MGQLAGRSQGWRAGVESKADGEWQDLQGGSGMVVWSSGKAWAGTGEVSPSSYTVGGRRC